MTRAEQQHLNNALHTKLEEIAKRIEDAKRRFQEHQEQQLCLDS